MLTGWWRQLFGLSGSALQNSIALLDIADALRDAVSHPAFSWMHLLIAAFMLPILWVWSGRANRTSVDNAFVVCAAVVAIVSSVIGRANEIRVFLPAVTLLVLAGLMRSGVEFMGAAAAPAPVRPRHTSGGGREAQSSHAESGK